MNEKTRTPVSQITDRSPEYTAKLKVFTPKVDIYENQDFVVIEADMPGVNETSLDVTIENHVLTLHGRVSALEPSGPDKHFYKEIQHGDYHRSFSLSEELDQNKIQATVKNGVARLTLPIIKEFVSKKIPVTKGN
jgi:HSP20 family molecular chaperone IbpA